MDSIKSNGSTYFTRLHFMIPTIRWSHVQPGQVKTDIFCQQHNAPAENRTSPIWKHCVQLSDVSKVTLKMFPLNKCAHFQQANRYQAHRLLFFFSSFLCLRAPSPHLPPHPSPPFIPATLEASICPFVTLYKTTAVQVWLWKRTQWHSWGFEDSWSEERGGVWSCQTRFKFFHTPDAVVRCWDQEPTTAMKALRYEKTIKDHSKGCP